VLSLVAAIGIAAGPGFAQDHESAPISPGAAFEIGTSQMTPALDYCQPEKNRALVLSWGGLKGAFQAGAIYNFVVHHPDQKLQPWVLESEMGRLREKLARDKIMVDWDAGLHTLRHTFLTEAGEHTDVFNAAVHRRARHHQDHDALCPPSVGVGEPGVRADQPAAEKEASGVGVADRELSHESSGKSAVSVYCKECIQKRIH
jgi:hypothetical protein